MNMGQCADGCIPPRCRYMKQRRTQRRSTCKRSVLPRCANQAGDVRFGRSHRTARRRRSQRQSSSIFAQAACARGQAPWYVNLAPLAKEADGILIGNGPGDPKDLGPLIEQVRGLLADGAGLFWEFPWQPDTGTAASADTYKLPYGHRGLNQPVSGFTDTSLLHHQSEP